MFFLWFLDTSKLVKKTRFRFIFQLVSQYIEIGGRTQKVHTLSFSHHKSLIIQIVSRLRTKTTSAFYFTGIKQNTPNCPVDIVFDFNPSSAYYSYSEGSKDCASLAKVNIPFFLDKLGPKYEEVTVLAHEAYPGHHLEVSHTTWFHRNMISFSLYRIVVVRLIETIFIFSCILQFFDENLEDIFHQL